MHTPDRLTRRDFVKASAAAASLFALPRFAIGQAGPSANGRLNLAFVGAGGIANNAFSDCDGENYVALCDVDDERAASNYAKYPDAKRFKDFRVMLDEMHREIDAVVVSCPDHTHFAAAFLAMQAGKHVYVQKPLTHDIWQARTLRRAAQRYKVVTQMGNQGHATEGIRLVKEWYEAGVLGQVREVHAWFDGPDFERAPYFRIPATFPPAGVPAPAHIDWDLWLGPAKKRPYSPAYHPLTWRGFWDFGCGELGDWACHTLDAPFWALDLDQPTRVSVVNMDPIHPTFCPRSSHIKFEFPARGDKAPVALHWYDGGQRPPVPLNWDRSKEFPKSGMLMVGDKETLMTGARPNSPRLLPDALWEDFRRNLPAKTIPRVLGGPFQEWIRAIKGEGPQPGSNFDYSARLTEMSLVGVMAQRTGRDIEWDAAAMRVTNHKGFESLVREPARRGWNFGDEVWRG
ncbi:Gfo/Idh/MocA family protein [Congregicoccus parvus]|uniref:Gfo/Idh/MocA family protein n=1 Tax=Congregicoccus parvus TaxID=3081749 RepID=UPI003FA5A551